MNRLILIPVRGRERVEELLPYLADIIQPGTKIIFLMHLGTRQFEHQLDKLLSIQSDANHKDQLATRSPGDSAASESDLDDQIEQIRQHLQNVEVGLTFYRGSLRTVTDQLAREQHHLVVMLRPASSRLVRWFYKILYAGSFPRPPANAPVLLCHLSSTA